MKNVTLDPLDDLVRVLWIYGQALKGHDPYRVERGYDGFPQPDFEKRVYRVRFRHGPESADMQYHGREA
jgi:hypothetical protein